MFGAIFLRRGGTDNNEFRLHTWQRLWFMVRAFLLNIIPPDAHGEWGSMSRHSPTPTPNGFPHRPAHRIEANIRWPRPSQTGQVKSSQVKSGQAKSSQVSQVKSSQVKSSQVKSSHAKSAQVSSGQVRSVQVKSNHGYGHK